MQLDYGNWIRRKNLVMLGAAALAAGGLIFLPLGGVYRAGMALVFALVLASFLFPLYAYVMFSQKGGRLQEKIYDLIIQCLGSDVKGRFLDIGSGNGVLAVKLALRYKKAEVTGMDYWGRDWEYSKGVCEQNAQAAGVEGRARFEQGDAARLNFEDGSFDGAMSNLTFHEVKSAPDKREVLREALRVVAKGGRFAFVDYFLDRKYYGEPQDFENYLRGLNLARFEFRALRDVMRVPLLLWHPRILGRVAIIYGRK